MKFMLTTGWPIGSRCLDPGTTLNFNLPKQFWSDAERLAEGRDIPTRQFGGKPITRSVHPVRRTRLGSSQKSRSRIGGIPMNSVRWSARRWRKS
jgi:hypothetical protein